MSRWDTAAKNESHPRPQAMRRAQKEAIVNLKMLRLIVCIVLTAVLTGPVFADDTDTATAMVKKAIAFYKQQGFEKFIDDLSKPTSDFNRKELYVFVYDMEAVMIAHPNPTLIGRKLLNAPDAEGKFFRKEIVELAKTKGSGWVDYVYKNPETGKVEPKTTYIEKVEDMIFACGTYRKK